MRLKQLTNEELETSIEAAAIRYRVKCDSLNLKIIRQTLQNEYANYFLKDFNNAFIKHCAGKFMISKDSEGNKPYGDLSSMFVCSVLKSYSEYMSKARLIKPLEELKTNILQAPKKSKEENAKEWFEFIEKEFNEKGKVPLLADWNAAYWHMSENKLINLDKDHMEMFAENVRAEMEHDIKVRKAEKRKFSIEVKILNDPRSFKLECRKRYLINHYENLKNK